MEHKLALLDHAISIDEQYQYLRNAEVGGICLFIGTIRKRNQSKAVKSLEMEAYGPMAKKQMQVLMEQASKRWPIKKALVVHRTGPLEIGDVAVVIGVASEHRAEAFAACQWLIDTLKQEVPIWKHEHYLDGSSWLVPHP